MCVCKEILFLVEKCKSECKEKKKVEKVGGEIFPKHHTYPTPKSPLLSSFAAPKVFSLILFSWLHQTRKSSSFTSFSIRAVSTLGEFYLSNGPASCLDVSLCLGLQNFFFFFLNKACFFLGGGGGLQVIDTVCFGFFFFGGSCQ